MKFLKNIDYSNIDKGIEYLKSNKLNYTLKTNEITIFHVYWYGKLTRHQLLCIYSYLYSQNLKNTSLWVWLDINTYKENKELVINHDNIVVKCYDPNIEVINTPFVGYKYLDQTTSLKFRSDIARIIVLYKYGGLYFDLDMLLLKDLTPLLDLEFCYSWSDFKRGNNGILRLKKESNLAKQLIKKYKNTISPFNLNGRKFYCEYNHKYIFTENIDLMCLPCVLFDPVWILEHKKQQTKYSKLHKFDDFFKITDENIDHFFANEIFTYHWHSRKDVTIEHNSYFEKFENKFKHKIK